MGKDPAPTTGTLQRPQEALKGRREALRFRCPCCGLLPHVDTFTGEPHEFRLYRQEWGGSVSLSDQRPPTPAPRGRGRPPKAKAQRGVMSWADVTEEMPAEAEELIQAIAAKLRRLAAVSQNPPKLPADPLDKRLSL